MLIFVSGIVAFLAMAIPFLDGRIWTWSDEVWNWTELAQKGPRVAATYYPAANNHVFLTVLQSLWPREWIEQWPPLLRLWGIALQLLILSLAVLRLERRYRLGQRLTFIGLLLLALLCIPWMLDWTFYARGYPVATALLILFAVESIRVRPSPWILVAAITLCVYTLPTMVVPGALCGISLILQRTLERRKGSAMILLMAGLLSGISLFVLYSPLLEQMLAAARILSKQVEDENPPLLGQFFTLLQNPLYFALFMVSTSIAVMDGIRTKRWSATLLILAAVGSIWTFDFLANQGLIGRPFLRNAHFFVPLLVTSAVISVASIGSRFPGLSAMLSLFFWTFLGVGVLTETVPHWMALRRSKSPARDVRHLLDRSNRAQTLECAWFSEPSCLLISTRYGILYNRMDVPVDGPCEGRIDTIKVLAVDDRTLWFCGR